MLTLTLVLFALVVYAHWVEPAQLSLHRTDIPVPGLPEELAGYTLLLSSDLHSAWFGEEQARVERLLDAEAVVVTPHPLFDAAVFAGDLIDIHEPDPAAGEAFLSALSARAPTIFSAGNHDVLSLEAVTAAVKRSGALDPGALNPEGVGFALPPGRDPSQPQVAFVATARFQPAADDLRAAVEAAGERAALVVVILHARTDALVEASRAGGAHLVVAGHEHGGQIALPLVGPVWTPSGGWFPGRSSGLFAAGDLPVFISRGLGTSVVHLRFFAPPTLDLLRLVPASDSPSS